MCSIGGVRRFGQHPIRKDQLDFLLTVGEKRGNDAAGVALQQEDGSISVFKKAGPAWQMIASKDYEKWMEENLLDTTQIALIHTRSSTQGSPKNPLNNHPLFNGLSVVVHNGGINNEGHLYNSMKLPRLGEVDSDIFRAIVDGHQLDLKVAKQLNKCNGSAAIAMMDTRRPGYLLLGKSGPPLSYGILYEHDHLLFASIPEMIYASAKEWTEKWGIWGRESHTKLYVGQFPEKTLWLLGPDGLEDHTEFNVCSGQYYQVDYKHKNKSWGERNRRYSPATVNVSVRTEKPDPAFAHIAVGSRVPLRDVPHGDYCECQVCQEAKLNERLQRQQENIKKTEEVTPNSQRVRPFSQVKIKCLDPKCKTWSMVDGADIKRLWTRNCPKCGKKLQKDPIPLVN